MGLFDGIKKVASGVSDFLGSPLGQFTGKIAGDFLNRAFADRSTNSINQQNADLQREFAQNSIQWRVQDAKNAGIHPLYALGASTISAQPSFVGNNAGIDFGSAFNALTHDKKYEEAIKNQTLMKNDMELKRLALENAQLQKSLDAMGQTAISRNRSQVALLPVSTKKETGYEATTKPQPRWEVNFVGDTGYLSPSSDSGFSDLYSEGFSEKIKHVARSILDYTYLSNIAQNQTNRARRAGILAPDEYYRGTISFNGLIPEPVLEKRNRMQDYKSKWQREENEVERLRKLYKNTYSYKRAQRRLNK